MAITKQTYENTSKASLWLQELRAPFLIAVIIPVVLGAMIAANETGWDFNFVYFFLTLIGIVCIHLGANVSNDYFDYKSGADVDNPYRTPFSGGSGLVGHGENLLRPRNVFIASIILYCIGAGIGIYLDLSVNDPIHFIFILGLLGVGASFFYTAPPFKFVYRGLGELAIATTFGTFVTVGSDYVQTVQFSWDPLLASLPVGALIMGILYINEFPDHFADKRAGKKHWVVQLGLKRAIKGYVAIIAFTYISIFFAIALGLLSVFDSIHGMPIAGILTLLAIPTVIKTIKTLETNYDKPLELISASAGQIQIFTLIGIIICIAYGTRLLDAFF